MRLRVGLAAALVGLALGWPSALAAQDTDVPLKVAGTDVPVPKRTKFVVPAYPAEAAERGLRGIVILELVINEQGKVATADVVRSVPPFDEAALEAVRQWEYEVTKVDGKAVRVRHTLPITFALKLPAMNRQDGVPELRQGVAPTVPAGADRSATVRADVTLHRDGSVADAAITAGDSPFAEALLQAVRTWRFAPEPEGGSVVSFRVEAEFVPGKGGAAARVDLALKDARRTAAAAEPAPEAAPSPAPTPDAPASEARPAPESPSVPAPAAPEAPEAAAPSPAAAPPPDPLPPAAPPTPPAPTTPSTGPTPPPVEVIAPRPSAEGSSAPGTSASATSGAAATPAAPPRNEPGFSAVRDVTLGPGVPDLAKGRRPVVPPIARMTAAAGVIDVQLAVDAAGGVSVQNVTGPEVLREAARQAALSWSFRRTTADRLYLVATFTYTGDQARAEVRRAQ